VLGRGTSLKDFSLCSPHSLRILLSQQLLVSMREWTVLLQINVPGEPPYIEMILTEHFKNWKCVLHTTAFYTRSQEHAQCVSGDFPTISVDEYHCDRYTTVPGMGHNLFLYIFVFFRQYNVVDFNLDVYLTFSLKVDYSQPFISFIANNSRKGQLQYLRERIGYRRLFMTKSTMVD
jgi:hypothetical protein